MNLIPAKYPKIKVPKQFSFDTDGNIECPNDETVDRLQLYAWSFLTQTGVNLTPAQASLLITHLHPFMQDPNWELETSARERILSDTMTYLGIGVPSKVGTLFNVAGPEDITTKVTAKLAKFDDTLDNRAALTRVRIANELSAYDEYSTDEEALEDANLDVRKLEKRAVEMVQTVYPKLTKTEALKIITEINAAVSYPQRNEGYLAFITGKDSAVRKCIAGGLDI